MQHTFSEPPTEVGDPSHARQRVELARFLEPSTNPNSLGRLANYEVTEILGRGGFGIVVKAFDEVLHRTVAIKILTADMSPTSPAYQRFFREARASAAIRHENVVQVHAIGEKPLPHIVMEYIPGQTLQQRINQNCPLTTDAVREIGSQIARGLAAAHALNIIHRDIKPANVILEAGPEARVKLTDFGLARSVNDPAVTQGNMIVGTPAFMSPEQARGHALDPRSDLFSLGTVLYAMCTRETPFAADSCFAVLHQVVTETPRPIREVNPNVPDWLCGIIEKLHAKEPTERFQSAGEVADLLSAAGTPRRHDATDVIPALQVPTGNASSNSDGTARRRRMRRAVPLLTLLVSGVLILGVTLVLSALTSKTSLPETTETPHSPGPEATADNLMSPDWEWGKPENLGSGVNTADKELSPTLTSDECTLIFFRDGKLWQSRRQNTVEPFGAAKPLSDAINIQIHEGATMTGDGLMLFFISRRAGSMSDDVWVGKRKSVEEAFGEPERLPAPVNSANFERAPVISDDGLTLLVTSQRAGTRGADVFMFTRKSREEAFGKETLLPPPISTEVFDSGDWVSNDRRVIICTRMEKMPFECRLISRPSLDAAFGSPQELAALLPPNAILDRAWVSVDARRLYFHSRTIPEGAGEVDLWMIRREQRKK